jgi:hypothetical protein
MKPPLRPLAADPHSWASIRTTSAEGSRSLATIAVQSPVKAAADDAEVA